MKQNMYDNVLLRVNDIIDKVSGSIASKFEKTNPFDKEPVPNDEFLVHFDSLTPENKMELIQAHGYDAFLELQNKAEQIRRRRNGNA